MPTTTKTNKNKYRPLEDHHVRALNKAGEARRIARMEARVTQVLALLAEKPYFKGDLEKAMGISSFTLYHVIRYAKEQNWIVSQGRYYLNPHTVYVAGGKVVRLGADA